MPAIESFKGTSDILSRVLPPLRRKPARRGKPSRFVTQSHALGRPIASPLALVVAAAVAIAVYLIGCRLSD